MSTPAEDAAALLRAAVSDLLAAPEPSRAGSVALAATDGSPEHLRAVVRLLSLMSAGLILTVATAIDVDAASFADDVARGMRGDG